MSRSKFWDKFEELMDGVGEYIEHETQKAKKAVNNTVTTIGKNNKINFSSSSSVSTVIQDGKVITVVSARGKTTIEVNGKEVWEEK